MLARGKVVVVIVPPGRCRAGNAACSFCDFGRCRYTNQDLMVDGSGFVRQGRCPFGPDQALRVEIASAAHTAPVCMDSPASVSVDQVEQPERAYVKGSKSSKARSARIKRALARALGRSR